MEYALGLLTTGSYERVLAAARWSERAGLASFALPDHYLDESAAGSPALDSLTHLAGLSRETTTIELALMMSPITFRHPAVLAKAAITIDGMSGGRFRLGIGAGWMDREHDVLGMEFPPFAERFQRLEDALRYLRAAFSAEPASHDGRFYRLAHHPFQPHPPRQVPIVVGGTGPLKTPRLAGLYADEFNIHSMSAPEIKTRIERAKSAASGVGRDPDLLCISYSSAVVAGATSQEYQTRLWDEAKYAGLQPDEMEERFQKRHTLFGSYEEVSARLVELERLGVTRFYLQRRLEADQGETSAILAAIRG